MTERRMRYELKALFEVITEKTTVGGVVIYHTEINQEVKIVVTGVVV